MIKKHMSLDYIHNTLLHFLTFIIRDELEESSKYSCPTL